MNKKIDTMKQVLNKLETYYENNLKFNSVAQMAWMIKEIDSKLEGKANALELKKIMPRLRKINYPNIFR